MNNTEQKIIENYRLLKTAKPEIKKQTIRHLKESAAGMSVEVQEFIDYFSNLIVKETI